MNEMKNYETEMLIDAEDLQELDEDERAFFESFGMLVYEDDED